MVTSATYRARSPCKRTEVAVGVPKEGGVRVTVGVAEAGGIVAVAVVVGVKVWLGTARAVAVMKALAV